MNPGYRELAIYRLQKSTETFLDAKTYWNSTSLYSTVNRLYYALFYAVSALLICRGFSSSKHSGVRSIFNKEFVKTGIIEEKQGELFAEMFNTRQKGDYADFITFEKKDVERWLKEAEGFLKAIETLIQKDIGSV